MRSNLSFASKSWAGISLFGEKDNSWVRICILGPSWFSIPSFEDPPSPSQLWYTWSETQCTVSRIPTSSADSGSIFLVILRTGCDMRPSQLAPWSILASIGQYPLLLDQLPDHMLKVLDLHSGQPFHLLWFQIYTKTCRNSDCQIPLRRCRSS